MRLLYVVVIISVVLTGCESLLYKEPMAGPQARVRFVTETEGVTVLRVYNDTHCTTNETEWMRLRDGFVLRSTPKVLGMPLWKYHKNAAKEVFVEANKLLNGLFTGSETVWVLGSAEGSTQSDSLFTRTEWRPTIVGIREGTDYHCATPFSFRFSESEDYEVTFRWDRGNCSVVISQFAVNNDGPSLLEVARFDNRVSESNNGCLAAFRKSRLY